MPLYFFDIKDGHRLVDPRGRNLKNDAEAIAKAKVMAIDVSLDKPSQFPARSIVVIDDDGREIFRQPVQLTTGSGAQNGSDDRLSKTRAQRTTARKQSDI